jgi:predicted nucleic acid-binding protein
VLRNELGHRAAIAFLDSVHSSPRIERIVSTQFLEDQAEAILRRYDDQDFSYTDAVSFALMKARGLKEAFTFDQHFSTMGFRCVPPERK